MRIAGGKLRENFRVNNKQTDMFKTLPTTLSNCLLYNLQQSSLPSHPPSTTHNQPSLQFVAIMVSKYTIDATAVHAKRERQLLKRRAVPRAISNITPVNVVGSSDRKLRKPQLHAKVNIPYSTAAALAVFLKDFHTQEPDARAPHRACTSILKTSDAFSFLTTNIAYKCSSCEAKCQS